jgi:uncharacterized protein YjbI with pentapeptide repeats
MDEQLNKVILGRLVNGQPLDGLGLHIRDGRFDLSGLSVPEPVVARREYTDIADIAYLDGVVRIRDVAWRSLDFTGAHLPELRFSNCRIENCVFDQCCCREWKIWGTQVTSTSFRSANLRTSLLGGVEGGKRNSFRQVDFSRADLRGSVYMSAEFVGCIFKDANLQKVDFNWSTFADCVFAGELREVCFYRKSDDAKEAAAFSANDMRNVDFTHARLRWTEFRGLDLDTVRFPEDDEHIVVDDYPHALDRILASISGRTDVGAKRLKAVLSNERKWVGQNQRRGVLSKSDLREMAGEEGIDLVLKLVRPQSP